MLRRELSFEQKYNQLLNDIRKAVADGDLKNGDYILPENTMSAKYELSRFSVRKALAKLVEEGLIEKVPGVGNKVIVKERAQEKVETITLYWYDTTFGMSVIEEIIGKFERDHPNVKVNLSLLPEGMYVDYLMQVLDTNDGPDLFYLSDAHLRVLEYQNKLHLLYPYVPKEIDPQVHSYPNVFNMFKVNEILHAVPFSFSPIVMVGNQRILEEAGLDQNKEILNWDDLVDSAYKCMRYDADGNIEQYGFCFSLGTNRWQAFVCQNDGQFFANKGKLATFSDARTVEALQFCSDLIYKHQLFPAVLDGLIAERVFSEGNAAMILTSYYFMNMFRELKDQWRVMPVFGQRKPATIMIGSSIGLNSKSKKINLSKKLVEFMIGTKGQTILKRSSCTIPILKSVAENDELLDPKIHPINYNVFKEIVPFSKSLKDLDFKFPQQNIIKEELDFVWTGIKSPKQVCKKIDTILNR